MPPPRFDPRNEKLFATLAQLEAASIDVLRATVFDDTFRVRGQPVGATLPPKGAANRLRRLLEHGYLERETLGLPAQRGRQLLFRLSEYGRHIYPVVATLGEKAKPLSRQRLQRAWVRGCIWKAIAQHKASGLTISQGSDVRQELRQVLTTVRATGPLPFDILQLRRDRKPAQWFLIVVDDGETLVDDLVSALPLHDATGAKMDVCLRPIDDSSEWSTTTLQFREGQRLKALRLLCEATPQYRAWAPKILRGVGALRVDAPDDMDQTAPA